MTNSSTKLLQVTLDGTISAQLQTTLHFLRDIRKLSIEVNGQAGVGDGNSSPKMAVGKDDNLLKEIKTLAAVLRTSGYSPEANALLEVCELGTTPTDFGGLGLREDGSSLPEQDLAELLFLMSAHLEALNSIERAKAPVPLLSRRPPGRRGMTLSEKIFAAHSVDRTGQVKPGDMIRVDVDWIMASELSWKGMEYWYDRMGKPSINRNDRFWLAGDHLVDPRVLDKPKIKAFVDSAERAKRQFRMTDNQGMNYTIMHTEFCRERAQPGMLVIGSDSHTCSGGSMSCLAIGLGVADVLLPLITGETWFKVPETLEIRFINKPKPGIGGKDVILYILKELKRNTVAAERVVEYTGPGVKYLSCDARFAIANMTTEFGGVTGVFVPDAITRAFINKRKKPRHRNNSIYFRPDEDAEYVDTHIIDLGQVESFVARYPKPDDVVPVAEVAGLELHGCFIGACTTAEEDLVLAAMVLEEAMKRGARPAKGVRAIRKVVPGSLPILHKLRRTGLAEIYETAGWEIGVPSCSYCVGASADQAKPGEVWLTSQNRNFENRMGPGAFGNLASAVTVAASSFDMRVTDPASLLDAIDMDRVHEILGTNPRQDLLAEPEYVEPGTKEEVVETATPRERNSSTKTLGSAKNAEAFEQEDTSAELDSKALSSSIINGKVFVLPDFVDTDALAPAEAMSQPDMTVEGFGAHCLYHTHPDFRQKVQNGQNIVVAGEAFGCGSSREQAVWALQGAGVQCVIAKSFAFIYARSQPNLGLLGIEIRDAEFHELATEGTSISVDLDRSVVELEIGPERRSFAFQLSTMQQRLLECGGAEKAFGRYGKNLWEALTAPSLDTDGVASKSPGFVQLEVDAKKVATEW